MYELDTEWKNTHALYQHFLIVELIHFQQCIVHRLLILLNIFLSRQPNLAEYRAHLKS